MNIINDFVSCTIGFLYGYGQWRKTRRTASSDVKVDKTFPFLFSLFNISYKEFDKTKTD